MCRGLANVHPGSAWLLSAAIAQVAVWQRVSWLPFPQLRRLPCTLHSSPVLQILPAPELLASVTEELRLQMKINYTFILKLSKTNATQM